jgi:hypothetical protein
MQFVGTGTKAIPIWLAVTYLSSNVVLNSLNFYWFGKMIETVRKRFDKNAAAPPSKATDAQLDEKTNGKADGDTNATRRRRRRKSSLVLDVADGLQRVMMDGAVEAEGRVGDADIVDQIRDKLSVEQSRELEEKIEARARSSAVENGREKDAAKETGGPRRR